MASLLVSDVQVAPHDRLSDREFLILRQIAAGKSVSIIARELSLSVKTVSTYRCRLLEKMGLTNNSELVHYAFQNHLVETPVSGNTTPPLSPPEAATPPAPPPPTVARLRPRRGLLRDTATSKRRRFTRS
jgi:DNA-binding CsgD family transcriptional regulator